MRSLKIVVNRRFGIVKNKIDDSAILDESDESLLGLNYSTQRWRENDTASREPARWCLALKSVASGAKRAHGELIA